MKHVNALFVFVLMASMMSPLAAQSSKLPYPAREALRRQSSNITKAEQTMAKLEKYTTYGAFPQKPQEGLGLTPLLDSIENDLTKNGVPKDHADSKPIFDKIAKMRMRIPEIKKILDEKHAKFLKLADPKNYPHLEKDIEQLEVIWRRYAKGVQAAKSTTGTPRTMNDGTLLSSPALGDMAGFQEAAVNAKDDAAYFNGAMKRNAIIMNVNPGIKNRILAKAKPAQKYLTEFFNIQQATIDRFPANIKHNMKAAQGWIDKAKAEKKPMYFKGGVRQSLEHTEKSLKCYLAIKGEKDATGIELAAAYAKLLNNKKEVENTLAEQLLNEARMAGDKYTGSDKEKLRVMIKDAWAKKYPKDQILKITVLSEDWKRHTAWKRNAVEWYKVDTSNMLFNVAVKDNDKVATIYAAYLNKNHMQGNKISPGVATKGSGYSSNRVLIKNLK